MTKRCWMKDPWTCPRCKTLMKAGGQGGHLRVCGKPDTNFWNKVNKRGAGGCWLWTGALDSRDRGALLRRGRRLSAHRVSWEMKHGPIPGGLWVLHHCDVRNCVNPAHLYLGDLHDNANDRTKRGRWRGRYTPVDQLLHPHLSKRLGSK